MKATSQTTGVPLNGDPTSRVISSPNKIEPGRHGSQRRIVGPAPAVPVRVLDAEPGPDHHADPGTAQRRAHPANTNRTISKSRMVDLSAPRRRG